MKVLQIVVVLSAVFVVTLSQSNHAEWGIRQYNDKLLFQDIVQKSYSPLQIVTKDVVFPAKGYVNNSTIHYIYARDQYTNGNGGYASLTKGGLNQKHVTVHFKSQRGHGFNFILEIWGS